MTKGHAQPALRVTSSRATMATPRRGRAVQVGAGDNDGDSQEVLIEEIAGARQCRHHGRRQRDGG